MTRVFLLVGIFLIAAGFSVFVYQATYTYPEGDDRNRVLSADTP